MGSAVRAPGIGYLTDALFQFVRMGGVAENRGLHEERGEAPQVEDEYLVEVVEALHGSSLDALMRTSHATL